MPAIQSSPWVKIRNHHPFGCEPVQYYSPDDLQYSQFLSDRGEQSGPLFLLLSLVYTDERSPGS